MFIIVDNFYQNPDYIREEALKLDFTVTGNYPGIRTEALSDYWRETLKNYIQDNILRQKITYFPDFYNTAFQYTTENAVTWVHHDETVWAGVIYMTPNAPIEAGTGIYQHKESKIFQHQEGIIDYNDISTTLEDWDLIAFAGNIYNRLVLYKGSYYHRSVLPGFGINQYDGRLFQTFFFDTEA